MKRDWKALLAEYHLSGLSQAEYERSKGLSAGVLSAQLRKERDAGSFKRVETGRRVELELSGGVLLRVFEGDLLSKVLKALRD